MNICLGPGDSFEFDKFYQDYSVDGLPNGLRLGQFFMNTYFPLISMPTIFYEIDNVKAIYSIVQFLIDREIIID